MLCRLRASAHDDRFDESIAHVCGLFSELADLSWAIFLLLITNSAINLCICTDGNISCIKWFFTFFASCFIDENSRNRAKCAFVLRLLSSSPMLWSTKQIRFTSDDDLILETEQFVRSGEKDDVQCTCSCIQSGVFLRVIVHVMLRIDCFCTRSLQGQIAYLMGCLIWKTFIHLNVLLFAWCIDRSVLFNV